MTEFLPWISLTVSTIAALGGLVLKLQESEKERRFAALELFATESRADRQSLRAQNYALQTEVATLRQQLSSNTADTGALRYQVTRLEDKIDVIVKQLAILTGRQQSTHSDLQ